VSGLGRILTTAGTTAATLTALAGSAAVGIARDAAGPPVGRCSVAQLRLVLTPDRFPVGGDHRGVTVELTDTSPRSCGVTGYGSYRLTDSRHRPLPTLSLHGSTLFAADPGAHPVVLSAGGTAYADLGWTAAPGAGGSGPTGAGTDGAARRRPAFLELTPPHALHALRVAFTASVAAIPATLTSTAFAADVPAIHPKGTQP